MRDELCQLLIFYFDSNRLEKKIAISFSSITFNSIGLQTRHDGVQPALRRLQN